MTAIQQELRRLEGLTPEAIATHFFDNYGIIAQLHHHGALWLFDYDQLAAHKHRMTDMVMESRGLILCAETLDIVRRPFARFFNIGEAPAYESDIDYEKLEALEKVDGSLVTLYYNKVTNHWHFGTRGTPFAEGRNRHTGKVMSDLISRAAGLVHKPGTSEFDKNLRSAGILDPDVTYLFEFIGPDNPHVTRYTESELVLLGARRLNGIEYTPQEVNFLFNLFTAVGWRVRMPKRYPIPLALGGLARSLQVEAIKNWVASAPEFKGLHEGVVCINASTGKRLKVKTPLYCAVHLQGDEVEGLSISKARVADLIVNGDADEFCLYFPALAPKVQAMAGQVQAFIEGLAPIWEEVKDIADQKDFAVAVQAKAPGAASAIFFLARKTGVTPAQAWMGMPLNKKASLAEKLVG